ncbi:hypothetical protein DPMN_035974 [Dreissena polymorpha]|uniref:Secreted protein n=1 Tax=Dreissena polymorpha TaxID=45954 RepID=A0A9D4M8B9_DREPO|nr:hypothetical protein DPMN_035974 [Dreissena polymorpha]
MVQFVCEVAAILVASGCWDMVCTSLECPQLLSLYWSPGTRHTGLGLSGAHFIPRRAVDCRQRKESSESCPDKEVMLRQRG